MSDRLTSCGPRDCAAAWRGHGVGWSEYGLQTRAALTTFVKNFAEWAEKEKAKIARKDFIGGEFMIKGA
jgi:hypothetical protein